MIDQFNPPASAPSAEEVELITLTSRDYIEGWCNADAQQMRRCLHPELVKRTVMLDPGQGRWLVRHP